MQYAYHAIRGLRVGRGPISGRAIGSAWYWYDVGAGDAYLCCHDRRLGANDDLFSTLEPGLATSKASYREVKSLSSNSSLCYEIRTNRAASALRQFQYRF